MDIEEKNNNKEIKVDKSVVGVREETPKDQQEDSKWRDVDIVEESKIVREQQDRIKETNNEKGKGIIETKDKKEEGIDIINSGNQVKQVERIEQIKQVKQIEQATERDEEKKIKQIQEIQKEIDERDEQLIKADNMIEKLKGANITDYTIMGIREELQRERNELRKKQIEIGTCFLDNCVKEENTILLGNREKKHLKSSLSPFEIFPNYKVKYPEVVIKALGNLYNEYNQAFTPLIEANREWSTDYQYCTPNNNSINWCVQIDMVGLPEKFLEGIKDIPEEIVRGILRKRIFEIENSIAMYQLLENLFSKNEKDSFFKTHFREVLNYLRERFNKPIALLAVTELKYISMMETEFGKKNREELTDKEVKNLSGFDRFFGPEEFKKYLTSNNGQCDYLLYTRSSDPIEKLKKPKSGVIHELLNDSKMRQIIKENTLTLNIDNPGWTTNDMRRINDTKRYMPQTEMGFLIKRAEDLNSSNFITYLRTLGYNDLDKVILHCKPAVGTFGCYGHIQITLNKKEGLQKEINQRGDYIVQPKIPTPTIINMTNREKNTYIDRNFFGVIDGQIMFLGGLRNCVLIDSVEACKGRIHGNSATWAEILPQDKR